jgi:hypothetical protein
MPHRPSRLIPGLPTSLRTSRPIKGLQIRARLLYNMSPRV